MFNILVVEDEYDIRKVVSDYLTLNGFNVYAAKDGVEALDLIYNNKFSLMITDVMMPNKDGYSLTLEVRKLGHEFPIIITTAKDAIFDKEQGFDSGADDYMVKPLILKELLLRVNALLRRSKIENNKLLVIGNTKLDYETFCIHIKDKVIELPKKEFLLLFKLLANPNKIITKDILMDEIWGYDTTSDDSTIKVHISKIRDKYQSDDFEIITVKGLGYKGVYK